MAKQHKIRLATVCLHISAALYLIVGLLLFSLFISDTETNLGLPFATVSLLLCIALAAGIEFVIYGLRRRKFWAWVVGLGIFAVYVPSVFFPLGALGLWGLLDSGSRAEFGVGNGGRIAEQDIESAEVRRRTSTDLSQQLEVAEIKESKANFLEDQDLTPEQAKALETASSQPSAKVRTRQLPSRGDR